MRKRQTAPNKPKVEDLAAAVTLKSTPDPKPNPLLKLIGDAVTTRTVTVMGTFVVPKDLDDTRLSKLLGRAFDNGMRNAGTQLPGDENCPDRKDLEWLSPITLQVGPPIVVYVEVGGGNVQGVMTNRADAELNIVLCDHDNADVGDENHISNCAELDKVRDNLITVF